MGKGERRHVMLPAADAHRPIQPRLPTNPTSGAAVGVEGDRGCASLLLSSMYGHLHLHLNLHLLSSLFPNSIKEIAGPDGAPSVSSSGQFNSCPCPLTLVPRAQEASSTDGTASNEEHTTKW
ncbi:hypothetical protein L249_1857, partial [Ophiocordyceps polyrhachis-furcata BCC 54312]